MSFAKNFSLVNEGCDVNPAWTVYLKDAKGFSVRTIGGGSTKSAALKDAYNTLNLIFLVDLEGELKRIEAEEKAVITFEILDGQDPLKHDCGYRILLNKKVTGLRMFADSFHKLYTVTNKYGDVEATFRTMDEVKEFVLKGF